MDGQLQDVAQTLCGQALQAVERDLLTAAEEEAGKLLMAGRLCRQLGRTAEASKYLSRSLETFRERHDVIGQAEAFIELAIQARLLGQYKQALAQLHEARRILRPKRDQQHALYATYAYHLGVTVQDLGRAKRAEVALRRSHDLARQYALDGIRGRALAKLSDRAITKRKAERIAKHEEALAVARMTDNLELQVQVLARWQQEEDALEQRKVGYELAIALGSIELIITAGNALANVLQKQGSVNEGAVLGEKALFLAHAHQYLRLEALCLNDLSLIYRKQGRYEEAKALLRQAAALQRQFGGRAIAIVIGSLGSIHKALGEWDLALRAFNDSYKLHRQWGSSGGMRIQAGNIGTVYHHLEFRKEAREWYLRSRGLAIGMGLKDARRFLAGNLAALYLGWAESVSTHKRDRYLHQALAYADLAYTKAIRIKQPLRIMINAERKGNALLEMGKTNEGILWLYKAYRVARRIRQPEYIIRRLLALFKGYMQAGCPEMALKVADRAVFYTNLQAESASMSESATYAARAEARELFEEPSLVLDDYQKAIRAFRRVHDLAQEDETGFRITAKQSNLFTRAVRFSYNKQLITLAYDFMESGRQPVFQQQLATSRLRVPAIVPSSWLDQEQRLLNALKQLRLNITSDDDDAGDVVDLAHNLSTIQEQLQAVWDRMATVKGMDEYLALREKEPLSYSQVRQLLAEQ